MRGLAVTLDLGARHAEAAVLRSMAQSSLSPAGHQPMCSEDGQLVIVFKGESSDDVALRDELRARRHGFRSTRDTEVMCRAAAALSPASPSGTTV